LDRQLHVRPSLSPLNIRSIFIHCVNVFDILNHCADGANTLCMYTPAEASVTVTVFDSSDRTLFTSSGQIVLPPDSSAPVPGCQLPPLSSLKTNFSFVFVTVATTPAPDLPPPFPKTYWLSLQDDVLDWFVHLWQPITSPRWQPITSPHTTSV
jgi:hypothetical protein